MRALTKGLAAVGVLGLVVLKAGPAWAPFHLVVIEQAFFGSEDCPNAQYVMLRTTASGQTFVNGQRFELQNADGSGAGIFGVFQAVGSLPNAGEGVAITMGTAEAQSYFGLQMDGIADGSLPFPDGQICFFGEAFPGDGPADCIAYGAFTGETRFGSPAVAPTRGMALVRASETGDNSADFQLGAPAPENNAGEMGQAGAGPCEPPATPTTMLTPTPTPPSEPECVGDCDGDGQVLVNELVTGVNIGLGEATIDACPPFDRNGDDNATVDELVTGVTNALEGCPGPTEGLGARRFSLNPAMSTFSPGILNLTFAGFEGFLELTAGEPDPLTGIAQIDITDASEYLSIFLGPPAGIALCFRPDRSQFPIISAGAIDCDGGTDVSFVLTQDHNINDVDPSCETGTPDEIHPGVCNGPLMPSQSGGDSGPGALVIAPNPETGLVGLPMTLLTESALPCGDEGAGGPPISFAFTSAIARAILLDANNILGADLLEEAIGENFSCENWRMENGPGRIVLVAPVLDMVIPILGPQDLVSVFVWDD